jgi:proton glutamate symport protein
MSQPDDDDLRETARWRPSFTTLIVAGLVLGIAWGMFFGEHGSWLKWIGDAFVGLLQMTVLPFLAASLTCNVGRLSASQGGKLACVGLVLLLVLWGIGLLTLGAMSLSFPTWQAGSFFSTSLVEEAAPPDWLRLFIPSNPFWALANNLVPAVVLFSVGLGIALIPVANKETLFEKLDVLVDGFGRLNKLVVRLSPIGIFAITGHATGTMAFDEFALLQGYLLVYGAATVLLSFWVLPALISCCTPLSVRDVLGASRDLMITAFIIGNTFVVLPMIIEAVKRLMEQQRLADRDTIHSPDYTVQLAYPFPDVGRIVGLIFIPFGAWFYGTQINVASYPQLLATGVLGAFAKSVVTIPLLLNLAEIPADIFNLFLTAGVIAARFGDLMKSMHLLTFSVLTACYYSGILRINIGRMLRIGLTTIVLFAVTVISIRTFLTHSFHDTYARDKLIVARKLVGKSVESSVLDRSEPNSAPMLAGEDRIDRIRRTGIIRVGFDSDKLPFSYYNRDGQLVGFDIDMAHQLARDLGARIEFVPISAGIIEPLHKDHFDVAMSGCEGTLKRAAELPEMEPYMEVTNALVVPDYRRHHYGSLQQLVEELKSGQPLRVALIAGSTSLESGRSDSMLGRGWGAVRTSGVAEKIQSVELASAREFFERQPPVADILVINAEAGSAWTLKYPQFSVVKPTGLDTRTPLYYYVAEPSKFREFMGSWQKLKRHDGTTNQLYQYWILGEDDSNSTPRWCILRDVLHWIE